MLGNRQGIWTSVLIAMNEIVRLQKSTSNLVNNKCILKDIFLFTTKLDLLTPELFFQLYLKDVHKTLKGIGKTQFASKLTTMLNLQISKFYLVSTKKKIEIIRAWILLLMWESYFSVIHPTYIVNYSFWRTKFSLKVL